MSLLNKIMTFACDGCPHKELCKVEGYWMILELSGGGAVKW